MKTLKEFLNSNEEIIQESETDIGEIVSKIIKKVTGANVKVQVKESNKKLSFTKELDLTSSLGVSGLFKKIIIEPSVFTRDEDGSVFCRLAWRWEMIDRGTNGAELAEFKLDIDGSLSAYDAKNSEIRI